VESLTARDATASELLQNAYGYAVFNSIKISLWITGGGGHGVAVNKSNGHRTYMRMGTAGLNIGLGGQKYQIVFLFEDKKTFDRFVEKGWEADASANAVAGTEGANAEATFRNGMAYYQITDKGLMLQADIAGTKYWKNKKLNRRN
ncbi:MAG: lipid-binding SYLF domain-containing protein, partial [Candidatus Hydrogenedentales bacterium]